MVKKLKLYYLSQSTNNGYDTYDSCVVCAVSAKAAKKINPDDSPGAFGSSWTGPENVRVKYLGKAGKYVRNNEVVCASFRAG